MVNLTLVVAIRVVVAVRAVGATKGEKDCRTGADVGRSAKEPLSKEVSIRHPCDTTVALFPSGVMKGHIVTSEVQTELSVQVGLPNGEFKALRVLGARRSLWLAPMFLLTKSPKNMKPPNRGAYSKRTTGHLCQVRTRK